MNESEPSYSNLYIFHDSATRNFTGGELLNWLGLQISTLHPHFLLSIAILKHLH